MVKQCPETQGHAGHGSVTLGWLGLNQTIDLFGQYILL